MRILHKQKTGSDYSVAFMNKVPAYKKLCLVAAILVLFFSAAAQAAPAAVRKDAFLSALLAARGFETKPSVAENAAAILKYGIVTEAVADVAAPVTRGDALRWTIQSLGLSAEAGFLSHLDLPFGDSKGMNAITRGCLVVATRMNPALFKSGGSPFRASHRLSPDEAKTLLANVRRASQGLKLEVRFSPMPGMELEIYREGTFSGIPKWRVHIYGFDEKTEVDQMQQYLASQGLKTEAKNPNYEWSLRSDLLEDYARVRRLEALAKARGKSAYIFPSVMNANIDTQPLYWALLTMNPSRFMMEPVIAPGGITTLAPLSSMVRESGVKAAINAGFFSVSGRNRGAPIGTLRIGQSLVNKPWQGRTCLGWNKDNRAAFGEVDWRGTVQLDAGWMSIDALNRFVRGNVLTLYNPYYGIPTPIGSQVTEVLVENGRCVSVTAGGGTLVEPGFYVLAGYGTNATLLASHLKPGDKVRIESTLNEGDPHWNSMDDIIQAGPFLLRNGEIRIESEGFSSSIINLRHPRSVMGLTNTGKWVFFVGDGRNGMHSTGFTLREVATILKMKNVSYALNLDGGGSTELIVDNRVFNVPSDGRERPISYGVGARPR